MGPRRFVRHFRSVIGNLLIDKMLYIQEHINTYTDSDTYDTFAKDIPKVSSSLFSSIFSHGAVF
jgi:hypothetical protein